MKELTKRILESGIVDTHVAKMMERWGQLDSGASDLVGKEKITKQTFIEFAEGLETLLEKNEGAFRETRLDLEVDERRKIHFCITTGAAPEAVGKLLVAYVDSLDRLIVPISEDIRGLKRGGTLYLPRGGVSKTVLDLEPLFQGETLVALQLTLGE